jgi:CDP-diacylglycerol--glycerol-3-phosphate 3-phosphatidyltransferase
VTVDHEGGASWVPEPEAMTEQEVTTAYGPSALRTPANFVTVARLLVSPILFAMIADKGASWATFLLWVALAATDGVDGWIARRHGTTRSGAFLDPLADKVLVFGAMVMLVSIDRFWWLPVALIGIRELGVSLLRIHFGRQGLAIPATKGAKLKTLVQALAVGAALWPGVAEDQSWLASSLLAVAVVLTLFTGWQYFSAGRRLASTTGSRGAAAA